MEPDTRKLIDDLEPGTVLEIEYLGISLNDVRTGVGIFEGISKDDRGEWVLLRFGRPDIAFIDIRSIRVLPKIQG